MKKLFPTIFLALFFASCVSVEFTEPQPMGVKNLKKFPKEMRGVYQLRIVSGDEEPSTDTMIISDRFYEDQSKKKDPKVFLSDSCILRPFKADYFINFKGQNDSKWTCALIKMNNPQQLTVYGLFAGDDTEEDVFIGAIEAITNVNRIVDQDGTPKYDISPSNEELSRLVDERLFKPVYELNRIN